jgi:hypothetical protein
MTESVTFENAKVQCSLTDNGDLNIVVTHEKSGTLFAVHECKIFKGEIPYNTNPNKKTGV